MSRWRRVLTGPEGAERQDSLGGDLGAVVLHHGQAQEGQVLAVHGQREALAPHGV